MIDTKALRQKVLDLAIRGKLVPQDPNDEPASVLLERIRAQKQQMVKDGQLKAKDIKNDTVIFVGEDNLHYEKFTDGAVKCIEDEIPFDLPVGWAWERLSNIASFSGGKTPSTSVESFWGKDVLWVTSKDMKTKYIDSSLMRLSNLGAEQLQIYPIGTLLLVVRSGILRHTLPVSILKAPATVNQDLKAISPYYSNIEEYIYICFKGMENEILHTYTKAGATVENVNFDAFQKILLPFPPEEQIPLIISNVQDADHLIGIMNENTESIKEDIIQAKSKILDLAIRGQLVPQNPDDEPASVLLDRIRTEKEKLIKQGKIKRDKKESVIFKGEDNSYYEKIGDTVTCINEEIPFDLPENWSWCRGFSCFSGMTTKKPDADFFDYIDIDSIDNKKHIVTSPKHLPSNEAPSRASRGLQYGSVVFSLVRPYLKNIAFINENLTDCIASTGFYVCNSNGSFFPPFMFYLMLSEYVINGLNEYMKGDNSPSISKENIETWLYPVPPFEEQKCIVGKISELLSHIATIEAGLN